MEAAFLRVALTLISHLSNRFWRKSLRLEEVSEKKKFSCGCLLLEVNRARFLERRKGMKQILLPTPYPRAGLG